MLYKIFRSHRARDMKNPFMVAPVGLKNFWSNGFGCRSVIGKGERLSV